jgi:hypothetical protein
MLSMIIDSIPRRGAVGIYAVARGEVVAEPATVTTDVGTATVLVVRDCGAAPGVADASSAAEARDPRADDPRPDWLPVDGGVGGGVDGGVEYEVSCRRVGLARRVLADLLVGDRVVVVGSMRLDPVAAPVEDPTSMARISLEAVIVGWDLDG